MDSGSFIEYANGELWGTPIRSVVKATVKRYGLGRALNWGLGFTSMTVKVTEVIRGPFVHSELTLTGDDGGLSLSAPITEEQYPIGSEHYFSLSADTKIQPLDSCGESSVLIKGDTIEGGSTHYGLIIYTLDIQDFIRQLNVK